MIERDRIAIVDTLRGVASLLVLGNHLTSGLLEYPTAGWLRDAGDKGWIGVPIFFVISGFVIPYALDRAGYTLRDYGRFIIRRAIRIDIPCYASIAIICVLGLTLGSIRFETPPREISLPQVLLHLGYLNYICGYEFLNGVLWSLAIELQFYLVVALLVPFLVEARRWARLVPFGFLGVLAFRLPFNKFVFHYGFLFLLGLWTFQHYRQLSSRALYLGGIVLLAAGAYATTDAWSAGTATATALAIGLVRARTLPLGFFGKISYSLYLIHIPVGLRVLAALGRPDDGTVRQLAVLGAGGAASILAAWLLWRFVERPAQRWATLIRYGAARGR